jgi:hypothetical protein
MVYLQNKQYVCIGDKILPAPSPASTQAMLFNERHPGKQLRRMIMEIQPHRLVNASCRHLRDLLQAQECSPSFVALACCENAVGSPAQNHQHAKEADNCKGNACSRVGYGMEPTLPFSLYHKGCGISPFATQLLSTVTTHGISLHQG